MVEKQILIDIDDPRSDMIAEALSNKTAKKILGLLAEQELSAGDIAEKLSMPLNTIGYNIEKLVESGLIEKADTFFWSMKGKRILKYKLSNKKIVISPRKSFKGIIPAIIISAIIAFILLGYSYIDNSQISSNDMLFKANEKAMVESGAQEKSVSSAAGTAARSDNASINDNLAYAAATESDNEFNMEASGPVLGKLNGISNSWAWFLIGALTALVVYILWNWKK